MVISNLNMEQALPYAIDSVHGIIHHRKITEKAIQLPDNKNGYPPDTVVKILRAPLKTPLTPSPIWRRQEMK